MKRLRLHRGKLIMRKDRLARSSWYDPNRKFKVGDTVTYNVVTEDDYYNVSGDIVKAHKDGTFDVETAMTVDKRVEPEMVMFAEKNPAMVVRIRKRK